MLPSRSPRRTLPGTGMEASSPRVYGCVGRANNSAHRRLLDDLARVHHRHLMCDARHHAKVVRDQQHRQPQIALQLGKQAQDLRLHRDVERGGRLVGDQQLRLAQQRHGDHHALAQPAGQLVRELAQPHRCRADADPRQHRG